MREVYERVFVSNEFSCRKGNDELVVVHACKSPCHQREMGYRGSLPSTHPNYLVKEDMYDLYLNIIDPPAPLFMPPLFISFLAFSNKHWSEGRKNLVHCNQGESRAPSLALLFIAKCRGAISNHSYELAKSDFEAIYPGYNPGNGIRKYFSMNWESLGNP
ncbi:hypothetical protein JCM14076_32830 [Methylosoma difficile]